VEFVSRDDAKKARKELIGRQYGGALLDI